MKLSARFREAAVYALELHEAQERKGTTIPYAAHILGVASIALEHGADEEVAIAALLHDAAEDQGGEATLVEIRRRFGPHVAEIVSQCTDTTVEPKPPWRARKEGHMARLRTTASADALLVSMSDKLHNATAILRDYRELGEPLWKRFNKTADEVLWYYTSMVEAFASRGESGLLGELRRTVTELEELVRARQREQA